MLRQLLVSIAVSLCNIAIHAIVMAAVLWVARIASERAMSHRSFQLIAVMTATVSVLMVAHIAEVVVWTFAYAIVGVAPPGTDLIYFAFVNYTTLGYGDVTPLRRWELLGPMTAMNGVLLFGWSTAVIFAVLRAVMTSQTEALIGLIDRPIRREVLGWRNCLSHGCSSVPLVTIVLRRTAKMTAVDQPNNSTPFIAVIGPSKCQRCSGVTSP